MSTTVRRTRGTPAATSHRTRGRSVPGRGRPRSAPGRWPLPPQSTAGPALALIGAGGAGILALWWRDTFAVTGADQWLTDAGRITGLLAGYAAPVLLLLMARIPLLERDIGADRLARWHANGGRYLVGLVSAHVLTVIWGYALTAHRDVVGQGVQMVFHFPDMLKAALATLLMFATGALSARAARRRFGYETWYHLHLATYLAIALGFAHQLTNGADLGQGPGRAAWYLLYLGTFALLGWYRLAVPFLRDRRHRLRIAEVRQESPGVVSVFLTGERLAELRAEPGQFFRLQFLAPGLRWAVNPYSLSAPPTDSFLRFTVKDLGGHSAAVARLRPGVRVRAEGPYGAFTPRLRRSRKVLLIAGGVGITPIRSLFEALPAAPGDLTLLYRARHQEDLLFGAELEHIAAARGARLTYLVGSRSEIGDPLTAPSLTRLVPRLAEHEVFLCGPPALAEATVRALREAGVPRHRIHHESFVL
ncbi:ferric reductase-like transmembrane domain-containing protein [Kitasatospora sp. GP82]|uniref:ferredoxin reductase family protein n=1 Tax=Kitasatospora sp. GP82 TaxID=3035089 RepID=UPI002475D838|nr:ferric reductase-like transmembrane domain-containing protein [Kitasatospora sp. GP82]MDH6124031.1 ferredoxin-NADP reductase/DMSO/TMAO reductase YedYZ heme-binding membrane subunit [Kitasatospora sp. GP82]